jgi:hypothetical protein
MFFNPTRRLDDFQSEVSAFVFLTQGVRIIVSTAKLRDHVIQLSASALCYLIHGVGIMLFKLKRRHDVLQFTTSIFLLFKSRRRHDVLQFKASVLCDLIHDVGFKHVFRHRASNHLHILIEYTRICSLKMRASMSPQFLFLFTIFLHCVFLNFPFRLPLARSSISYFLPLCLPPSLSPSPHPSLAIPFLSLCQPPSRYPSLHLCSSCSSS